MRITSKGQVTIPQDIRERLGLLPNTDVQFFVERGAAVLRPKRGVPTRAERIIGKISSHPMSCMICCQMPALKWESRKALPGRPCWACICRATWR